MVFLWVSKTLATTMKFKTLHMFQYCFNFVRRIPYEVTEDFIAKVCLST